MKTVIRNACRRLRRWGKQVLVALDQLVNALFGGWADETLSSRCWRKRDKTGWKQARMALFWGTRSIAGPRMIPSGCVCNARRNCAPRTRKRCYFDNHLR